LLHEVVSRVLRERPADEGFNGHNFIGLGLWLVWGGRSNGFTQINGKVDVGALAFEDLVEFFGVFPDFLSFFLALVGRSTGFDEDSLLGGG